MKKIDVFKEGMDAVLLAVLNLIHSQRFKAGVKIKFRNFCAMVMEGGMADWKQLSRSTKAQYGLKFFRSDLPDFLLPCSKDKSIQVYVYL